MLSQEARGTLLEHPELFILHYFGHRIERLKDFHLELLGLATKVRRGLELYPATHGKTTLTSESLPIYEICKDPNVRIAGIFKNEKDGRAISRSIQNELTQNTELIEDFGPFVPKGDGQGKLWTQNRFDVANRTRIGKSSTFAAFGAGSREALGYRTDWTLCDDIVHDRNSSTEAQRDGFRQWFMQGPMTMPDSMEGRITMVGTAFHPADLYHDLMRIPAVEGEGKLWTTIIRKAILEEGEVLWPEMRPMEFLEEQKAIMGTLEFNKRFQNQAVDPSTMSFREEYVYGRWLNGEKYPGCIDEGYALGDYDPTWKIILGFDPAVGVYRGHKFCSLMVLGLGSCKLHDRCWWVVDLLRDQMTLPQQVEQLIAYTQRYDAFETVIEANVYQAGLEQQVKTIAEERNLSINTVPHYTTRQNKPDPETGIPAMATMIQQGKLHIPWKDAASRARMKIFVEELVTYPGATTDTVMSLWFAWRRTQSQAPKFKAFNRLANGYTVQMPKPRPYGGMVIQNPYYAKDEDAVLG